MLVPDWRLLQADNAAKTPTVYRVDLVLRDSESGQKPNQRKFAMLLNEKEQSRINTGTRVPMATGTGQFNFYDVGATIVCRVFERQDQISLEYLAEVSDLSRPLEKEPVVVNQHKTSGSATVPLGKPIVLATWDEPGGKRRYELEVSASKVK